MKRSMAWPLIIMMAVLLSVFIPNLSQHAATQELQEGGGIIADVSPELGYLSPGERHKIQISDEGVIQRLQSAGARLIGDYGTFRILEVELGDRQTSEQEPHRANARRVQPDHAQHGRD